MTSNAILTERIRVCLDANVILTGSLSQRGPSAALHETLGKCSFVVPEGVLDEALARVSGLVPDDQLSVVRGLMQDYCRRLQALTMTGYPRVDSVGRDEHVKQAAVDAGCTAICTYDTDDFTASPVPAWTPVELFKHIDPFRHLFESPRVGECGTYLLATRIWGGDTGRLLWDAASESEIRVHGDGRVTGSGPAISSWNTHTHLPHGPVNALTVRYRPGKVEVFTWPDPDEQSAHLPHQLRLGSGIAHFVSVPRLGVIPHAEGFFASSVPCWLKEGQIRKGIRHRTLEIYFGERGVEKMLERMSIVMGPDGALVVWR